MTEREILEGIIDAYIQYTAGGHLHVRKWPPPRPKQKEPAWIRRVLLWLAYRLHLREPVRFGPFETYRPRSEEP